MAVNQVKRKLREGKCVYGTWVRIPSAIVVEALSNVGFDFLHIDLEHSSIDLPILDTMILAANGGQIPLVVRAASQNPADLYRLMDMGINSLMLPRIETAEQCEKLLSGIYYTPRGARGLGGAVRGNGWGSVSLEEHMEYAKEMTTVLIQIESVQGVNNLDSILQVQGIDVAYIGPFDLSQALGYPGQIEHPKVQETIKNMIRTIKSKGIAVGIHAADKANADYWSGYGVQYFTIGMDLPILRGAAASIAESLTR